MSVFDPDIQVEFTSEDAPEWTVLCKRTQYAGQSRIEASRTRVQSFLERYGLSADIVIVLSAAPSARATGWFATDDNARGGVPFTFDGKEYLHCYYSSLPGVLALSSRPLRPFQVRHEMFHAISSYQNGQILDEYDLSVPYRHSGVDSPFAVNKKYAINHPHFAEYNGRTFTSRRVRVQGRDVFSANGNPARHCIMYRLDYEPAPDYLIRRFVEDRLDAKINRPY